MLARILATAIPVMLAATPALAQTIGVAPWTGPLTELRTWIMIVGVFVVFACAIMAGSKFAAGRAPEGAIMLFGVIAGGALMFYADTLATSLTGA